LTQHCLPVRDIVRLSAELKADLVVIGAVGHSTALAT
jgi:nucleotide-binding universal stress UspA family protein